MGLMDILQQYTSGTAASIRTLHTSILTKVARTAPLTYWGKGSRIRFGPTTRRLSEKWWARCSANPTRSNKQASLTSCCVRLVRAC